MEINDGLENFGETRQERSNHTHEQRLTKKMAKLAAAYICVLCVRKGVLTA